MPDEKKCPECAELVKADAKVCRFCGHRFDGSRADNAAATAIFGKPAAKKPSTGAQGCGLLLAIGEAVLLIGKCSGDTTTGGSAPQADASKSADDKRKGFHCLSAWDGNSAKAEDALKATLRDPDSMETIETRITPVDKNGKHVLFMKYRAKNGFGGMNVGSAVFSVDNATCDATLVTSGDQ